MKLASLYAVTSLNSERNQLLMQRNDIAADRHHVVVSSKYLDDSLVTVARPALLREIDARVRRIEAQLIELGVTIA